MNNNKLLCTGCLGTIIAALFCFTPILFLGLGAVGLSAWLGWVDYMLFPVMFASMGLVALALYSRSGAKGRAPTAAVVIAVAALSALLFWLEFRYALRISLAAAATLAGYGFYLHKATAPPDGPAKPEEQA